MSNDNPSEQKKPGFFKSLGSFVIEEVRNEPFLILGVICLVIIAVVLFNHGGDFIKSLQSADVSRGLITFLVVISTVCIAILGAVYAMSARGEKFEEVKERFAFVKEILTLLIGILGTVLGFYFGSADRNSPPKTLSIAPIQVSGIAVYSFVRGGDAPFRYTLSYSKHDSAGKSGLSEDGWIKDTLKTPIQSGELVKVEILDSKGVRGAQELKYAVAANVPAKKDTARMGKDSVAH